MRAVIQRVSSASVTVDNQITGQIKNGLLVLLGVGQGDTLADLDYVFQKTIGLRVFERWRTTISRQSIHTLR